MTALSARLRRSPATDVALAEPVAAKADPAALLRENVELKRQLAEKTSIIERYEDAVRTIQAAASHDLISPLQNIFAFSRLLQREIAADDRRSQEYLDFIRRGADRMRLLVQALLDYTRHAPWQLDDVGDVDLGHAVNQAIHQLGEKIEETGAVIECGTLPLIEGDPRLIELLFRNLIDNAIKYRSDAAPRVRIDQKSCRRGARVTIVDNGIGLDMEFARSIFEPLKRLHGPMDRMGAGLGLATCYEIARSHGGTVEVLQSGQTGSSFCVTLPRKLKAKNGRMT